VCVESVTVTHWHRYVRAKGKRAAAVVANGSQTGGRPRWYKRYQQRTADVVRSIPGVAAWNARLRHIASARSILRARAQLVFTLRFFHSGLSSSGGCPRESRFFFAFAGHSNQMVTKSGSRALTFQIAPRRIAASWFLCPSAMLILDRVTRGFRRRTPRLDVSWTSLIKTSGFMCLS